MWAAPLAPAMLRKPHHAGPAYIVNKLSAANPAAMASPTLRSSLGKAAAVALALAPQQVAAMLQAGAGAGAEA